MDWLPKVRFALEDPGAPTLVIDLPLALSPLGVFSTLRLANEAQTWVPTALWRVIDEVALISHHAGDDAHPLASEEVQDSPASIMQWEKARIALGNRPLYWFAESLDEASLPKGMDANAADRFHALMADLGGFERLALQTAFDAGELDALALSAALSERASAILTLAESDDGRPRLAGLAEQIGVGVRALDRSTVTRVQQRWLFPLLMRAGLFELVADGALRLAYLRLVAPSALFAGEAGDDDAHTTSNWLSGAHLYWGSAA